MREWAGLDQRDRIASCTEPGAAATEEIGAALLANALLVYPTPGLLTEPPAALAAWLEAENISVACMAAATWNRLAGALAARKIRKPAKLRLVIATEGEPDEGSFGRIGGEKENAGVWVCRRTVLETAGGTIALDGKSLPSAARRLRVLDPRSRQPMPVGVIGELFATDGAGNQRRSINSRDGCPMVRSIVSVRLMSKITRADFVSIPVGPKRRSVHSREFDTRWFAPRPMS